MVHGWRKAAVKAGIWVNILWIALRLYRSPVRAGAALRALVALRRKARESRSTFKYARAGNRYFWDFYSPGWPSRAFDRHVENELNRVMPFRPSPHPLHMLLMAITKSCPLECEHYFECETLNKP